MIRRESVTQYIVPVTFLIIAAVMFVRSFSFSPAAQLFPQITAAVTIVGSLLLLFQSRLPQPLRRFVSEPVEVLDSGDFAETEGEGVTNERDSIVLGALTVGYVVLSVLIGMLYASPAFVFAYTTLTKQPWYVVAGLTAAGFVIPYGFIVAVGAPIRGGVFTLPQFV